MNELDLVNVISGIFITWTIGLTPPILIRHVVVKKPMEKWPAIGVCAFLWLLNFIVFSTLGSQSKTHAVLILIAFISYGLLRKKITKKEQAQHLVLVNEASEDGTTSLMGAAMLGKVKEIQKLIAAGASIDAKDGRGWTPLMFAASQNEVEAVALLLRNGADHTLRNNENQTATEIAQSKDGLESEAVIRNHLNGLPLT